MLVMPTAAAAMYGAACGGDDQPGGAGVLVDAAIAHDGSMTGDGAMGADAASDGTMSSDSKSDVVNDVKSESVIGSDGGDGDLPPPKDGGEDALVVPDAGCGPKTGFAGTDAGACSVGQSYTCQGDSYAIECDCPAAECRCKKNGAVVGATLLYGGCNACTQPNFALLASDCPVPYTGGP